MAKTILEEAMEDAKLLKETAIENAKNVLVEAISPQIKEFVDSQLGESPDESLVPESDMYEAPSEPQMQGSGGPMLGLEADGSGEGKGGKEEHSDEAQDLEMLAKLLKKLGLEAPMGMKEVAGMDEAAKKDDEEEEEMDKVEEVVEITNEDLKSALSEVLSGMKLQSEAHVTKGFGDAQDATPKSAGGAGAKGLADEKAGEHHW